MKNYIILLALLTFIFASCEKKGPSSSDKIPHISDLKISTDVVRQNNPDDTLLITFSVTDGDGDIGSSADSAGIYLQDDWGSNANQFYFPDIPRDVVDPEKGIIATCTVKVPSTLHFIIRPGNPPPTKDSVKFDVYVRDDARNESNHLTTPMIYILP